MTTVSLPPGRNWKVRIPHHTIINIISFALAFELLSGLSLNAQPDITIAPLSQDFIAWQKGPSNEKLKVGFAPEGEHAFGYIPPPFDRSYILDQQPVSVRMFEKVGAPPSYDSRALGSITPVKDQGNCGSCWTFGTFGSVESWLLKNSGETFDFSEQNLKNTHRFNWGHCDGGNYDMSTAYLTRWSGPVSEADDPYNVGSNSSTPGLSVRKHVKTIKIFSTAADIKDAVMTYGAVGTYMYYDAAYYNGSTYCYYYSGSTATNHAVTLAGWDDSKVVSGSPGNGAWLIKNSWGASWGDNGYFWISYHDSKGGKEGWAFTEAINTGSYTANYYYDTLGQTSAIGYSKDSAWAAAIYTPANSEYLSAIGFYALTNNTEYTITIYDNFSGGSFSTQLGTASGTLTNAGYHTISLPTPVLLSNGNSFGVVVKFKTPGYTYPIPMEYPHANYSSNARASAGQTYISSNGSSWSDMHSVYANTSVCIRALCVATVSNPASNIQFNTIQQAQMGLSWTNGNGAKRAVFLKLATSGTPAPANNSTYTANTGFGSGSQIGSTGWFCVYNGTGSSVTVTNLTPGATYRVMVCEYNGSAGSEVYTTTAATANPANRATSAFETRNLIIFVMDGARYTETFGEATHQYIPRIWNNLRPIATTYTRHYTDSVQETVPGHKTMLTGTWQIDGSSRPTRPTVFEYFRKELSSTAAENYVVLGKLKLDSLTYGSSSGYGSAYAASLAHPSSANQYKDSASFALFMNTLSVAHPRLAIVNMPEVDYLGHMNNWSGYLAAIRKADSMAYLTWNFIQSDDFYRDKTTFIIVNDHGRHTTNWTTHGDTCEGCRHIMLMVMGPDTPRDLIDSARRVQIDLAPTIGKLLCFATPQAAGSPIASAYAPRPPVPVSPITNAADVSTSTTLVWKKVKTCSRYRVQVAAASSFASPILDASNLADTLQAVNGLANATRYFWRVCETSACSTSAWATDSFVTIPAPPGTPTLVLPANSATNVALSPTLSWNSVSGATSYRLQVSTASDFLSGIVYNDSTLTGTSQAIGPLSNNTTYFWRVRAKNSAGVSSWATVWSFTTLQPAPVTPTLLSPANSATNISLTPTLSWNSVSSATSYRLQVATASNFLSGIVFNDSTLTNTSQAIGRLSAGTSHYWRVRAKNEYGAGAWSEVRNFVTETIELDSGLAGYWRFDESGGDTALDGSMNGHAGVLVNGATRNVDVPANLDGVSTKSLKLSGGTQYMRVNGMGYHDDYTVSLWVKCNAVQNAASPRLIDYGNWRCFLSLVNGSTLKYYVRNDVGAQYLGGLYSLSGDTSWHHIAAQLSDDTLKLYVDGVKVGQKVKTGALSTTDDNVYVGAENGIYSFNGSIDDVRMYSRALNSGEIISLRNGGGVDYNLSPVVNAGSDRNMTDVLLPVNVAMNSVAHDDRLLVSELTLRWRLVSGPASITFADSTSLSTDVTFTQSGSYVLQFSAYDGENTSYDSVTVNISGAPVDLTDGLAGYWRFDESGGDTALDGSMNGHAGVLVNGATRNVDVPANLDGVSTKSMKLSGGTQYMRVNGMGYHDDYTVSLWVKCNAVQNAASPRLIDYGNWRCFLSLVNGSTLKYYVRNDVGAQYLGGLYSLSGDTSWHHIAAQLSDDTLKLYVDGVKVGQKVKTGALSTTDDNVYVGAENGIYSFNGSIDDVRMYSRALNSGEIISLRNGGGVDYNLSPVVNAGSDRNMTDVLLPVNVAMNSVAHDDRLLVSELTLRWRLVSGPASITFADSTSLSTDVTFTQSGSYVLQFSAYDGENTSYDSVTVNISGAPVDLTDGLAGYWRFDESGGDTALDGSMNGHAGVLVNGATRNVDVPANLDGVSTKSMKLSGGTQYMRVNGMGYHDDYTVSLWVKCNAVQNAASPRLIDYGNWRCFLSLVNGSTLKYYVRNDVGAQYLGGLYSLSGDTSWHHIAAQLSDDTLKLYVDGVKVGQKVKTGALSTTDDNVYVGAENGIYSFNGSIDDVRMYSRALNSGEITTLFEGEVVSQGIQILSSVRQSQPTDLSTLVSWGSNRSSGASAFAYDSSTGKLARYLNPDALLYSGIMQSSDLRTFSAIDYSFAETFNHTTQALSITFSARQDTASAGQFSLVLMDNYPSAGMSGADISNFTTDPYGTPGLTVKLVPGLGKSIFQYSGSNGGSFDNYDYKWWLPGSVGVTDGSASLVPGEGQGYPLSSWKTTERAMVDTGWARYKWLVRPDCMELYKNDTLYGKMDLPEYSYTAPGYKYYDCFKALRMAWQGQWYVSDVSISTMPDSLAPNRPPVLVFVYPTGDTTVTAGNGMHLLVQASDADGTVDHVAFYANGQLLGIDTSAPYEFSWQNVPEGINDITATAIDTMGAVSVARIIKVQARIIE